MREDQLDHFRFRGFVKWSTWEEPDWTSNSLETRQVKNTSLSDLSLVDDMNSVLTSLFFPLIAKPLI